MLLCQRQKEFYITLVGDCGKTKVGWKRNRIIHQISFGKVRLKINYPGFGTYTHRNVSNYVGYYKDGLREWEGTWTLYDKINFVGIWKGGKRWNGTSYDEEGNDVRQYVNGELENRDNLLW
jgi:hypothetical protein